MEYLNIYMYVFSVYMLLINCSRASNGVVNTPRTRNFRIFPHCNFPHWWTRHNGAMCWPPIPGCLLTFFFRVTLNPKSTWQNLQMSLASSTGSLLCAQKLCDSWYRKTEVQRTHRRNSAWSASLRKAKTSNTAFKIAAFVTCHFSTLFASLPFTVPTFSLARYCNRVN